MDAETFRALLGMTQAEAERVAEELEADARTIRMMLLLCGWQISPSDPPEQADPEAMTR